MKYFGRDLHYLHYRSRFELMWARLAIGAFAVLALALGCTAIAAEKPLTGKDPIPVSKPDSIQLYAALMYCAGECTTMSAVDTTTGRVSKAPIPAPDGLILYGSLKACQAATKKIGTLTVTNQDGTKAPFEFRQHCARIFVSQDAWDVIYGPMDKALKEIIEDLSK